MNERFHKNRDLNEEETRQKKVKLDSFPQKLIVTLSSRCNLDCIMCEVRRTKWDIPYKTIQEVVDLFPYLESVIWQGGEPFLLEYFEEIFDEATKFDNLKQMIVTNGLLINEAWAHKLARNNVELTYSIDGVTKEVYEHIRGGAKFDRIIRSLKMIREARKKNESRKMSLRLHVVVMKSNYHQLGDFMDFAKEHGFDAIHLISMWGSQDREENIFYNNEKEALDYIESVRYRLAEKAASLNIGLLDSLPHPVSCATNSDGSASQDSCSDKDNKVDIEISCLMPWQQLNVDPGGKVRPGCLCLKEIGSILTSKLMDLWNNEAAQSYRRGIMERDFELFCNQTCLSVQISEQTKRLKTKVA
jgi:MoaA/NifB/PqqE/SkfB family radical SAM enzyme